MSSAARVREYRSADRAGVRHVCYETGLLGANVGQQYRDFESYVDVHTSYYTDAEPEHALVVERDERVVGYMLGCLDTSRAWPPMRIAARHALLRGVCFRPGTAGFYWRGLWDKLTDLRLPQRGRPDLARYPSHMHVNLLPEARGAGVGRELFQHMFELLQRAGSPGLHAVTAAENQVFLAIATQRMGFEAAGEPYPAPGSRLPDGRRIWLRTLTRHLAR